MVMDCIPHLMASQGHWSCAYSDDIIGVSSPAKASNASKSFTNLLTSLGFPVNQNKGSAPAREMACLGIQVNVEAGVWTIPQDKICEVKKLCKQWTSRMRVTHRALQKLLGHLIYLHKCLQPSHLFVNKILTVLQHTPANETTLLDAEFYRELNWFCEFLSDFNVITRIHKQDDHYIKVYVNASLAGIGAYIQGLVYQSHIPECYRLALGIIQFKMMNAMVTFRIWGSGWQDAKIKLFCDNREVVDILKNRRTKDPFLSACAR